jgi:hypothetical protein
MDLSVGKISDRNTIVQFFGTVNFPTQVDQNGVVYDPKTDRKHGKNGAFTALYGVHTVRFRSVSDRIIWRRITDRIVSVW